ncbi:hypothetical protein BJV82DRAFT_180908 [Fennellomyces sp. T-0311]|nr:hypothetical protein BJV82DRAFT_180908 [Fennellomyces sp. T-0311]
MNIFNNRLQSFHNNQRKWPHQGRVSAETLAKSGFYFTPAPSRNDTVQCFLCDARLDRWRNDDANERHRRMAPDCPWVILSFPDPQRALPVTANVKSTRLSSARVRTFKKNTHWPPKSIARQQLPTAKKLADSGFYYAPTADCVDRVACAYCLATVTDMDRTTDLLAQHDPSCIFFSKADNQGPVTRLRAAKTSSSPELPKKKTSLPPDKASLDDSIWDIGKAFAQKDRVRLTYSKKAHRDTSAPILPKYLTDPLSHPTPPPPAAAKRKLDKGKERATADNGKGRVSEERASVKERMDKGKQRAEKPAPPSSTIPQDMTTSSTPLRGSPFMMNDDNDLESLTLSPIRPAGSFRPPALQGIMQSTPNTQVTRTKRSVVSDDEDPRKRLKPFSPPRSPTRPSSLFNRSSLWIPEDEIEDDPTLTEAQLDMTVEDYIHSLVTKEIQNIQSTSEGWIQQMRAKVDQIRQTIATD